MSRSKVLRVLIVSAAAVGAWGAAHAADLPAFPDADDKTCASATETPECALKAFWMCNEQNVDICRMVGIELQADGVQKRDDGSFAGDVWRRPWTMTWSALLNEASKDYDVWELRGIREVAHNRIRGLRRAPEPIIGMQEVMVYMVDSAGTAEKASVFMEETRGNWNVVAFAKWRQDESVDPCDRRKLRSLACRFSITGMRPW